jgi:hypothetical protein
VAFALVIGVAAGTARASEAGEGGPPLEPRSTRPAGSETWPRACSFRHPACVRAPRATAARLATVIGAIDRAWDAATFALALPAPVADLADPYDVYVVDGALGGGVTFAGERDLSTGFDRARAFTLLDASLVDRARTPGCALDHVVARELLRASQLAAAPATDLGSARAETESLARLVAPCAATDAVGLAEFQRYDARAIVDTVAEAVPEVGDLYDRGAAAFFAWLDDSYAVEPGSIVRGMWALAPTKTPLGAWNWNDEPDGFDVLRSTFKALAGPGTTVDDLYVDFAIDRAFAKGLPPVRLDFDEPWPKSAVRYLSPNPTMPTGASYMRIRKAGAPDEARLRIEIEWESFARMRWVVVKLDASGNSMGRTEIAAMDRGTDANWTMNDLRGVDSLMIVGVGLGAPDRDFDPDDRVWEPHAWTVTVDER